MLGQFLINGLITGILYSLLAIGFALVYNTTRIFHIAAVGIHIFAAYMCWFFVIQVGVPVFATSLIAIVLTILLSLLSEVLVYCPLNDKKPHSLYPLIASISAMTFINTPQMHKTVTGIIVLAVFLVILRWANWGLRLQALSADETLFETLGYNTKHIRIAVSLTNGIFIAIANCLTVYNVSLKKIRLFTRHYIVWVMRLSTNLTTKC